MPDQRVLVRIGVARPDAVVHGNQARLEEDVALLVDAVHEVAAEETELVVALGRHQELQVDRRVPALALDEQARAQRVEVGVVGVDGVEVAVAADVVHDDVDQPAHLDALGLCRQRVHRQAEHGQRQKRRDRDDAARRRRKDDVNACMRVSHTSDSFFLRRRHRCAVAGPVRGRAMVNVLPRPGVLVTVIAAAVLFDDGLAQRQPQTESLRTETVRPRRVVHDVADLVDLVEDPLEFVLRNTDAGVFDRDVDFLLALARRDAHLTAVGGEANGVVE